jgi:hypothetical protein
MQKKRALGFTILFALMSLWSFCQDTTYKSKQTAIFPDIQDRAYYVQEVKSSIEFSSYNDTILISVKSEDSSYDADFRMYKFIGQSESGTDTLNMISCEAIDQKGTIFVITFLYRNKVLHSIGFADEKRLQVFLIDPSSDFYKS